MRHGVSIRTATAQDMDAVAALFREYADALGVDLSYQGFALELAGLPGAYAAPHGAILLATSAANEPIGCVAIRKLSEPGICEMKRLYARPEVRGIGIGRALALAAIEVATGIGYGRMRLDTLPAMSAAQLLYRELGFVTVPAYYDTPIKETIFMEKSLGSEVASP
jgi:GNAT superfamily N-acetyltransferase